MSTENLCSSILLLFFTVIALFALLAAQRFKIGRYSGLLLIALYVAYLGYAIYTAQRPDELNLEKWMRRTLTFFN